MRFDRPSVIRGPEGGSTGGAASAALLLARLGRKRPAGNSGAALLQSIECGSAAAMCEYLSAAGIPASAAVLSARHMLAIEPPAIMQWAGGHFVVLDGYDGKRLVITNPATGRRHHLTTAEVARQASGLVIFSKSSARDAVPALRRARSEERRHWLTDGSSGVGKIVVAVAGLQGQKRRNTVWALSRYGIMALPWRTTASDGNRLPLDSGSSPDVLLAFASPPLRAAQVELVNALNEQWPNVPILVVGDADSPDSWQAMMSVGAHEVIAYDGALCRLAARVRANARRLSDGAAPLTFWGGVECDALHRTLRSDAGVTRLSPRLYELFAFLLARHDVTVTPTEICCHAWRMPCDRQDRANLVAFSVHQLRKKLREIGRSRCLVNIRGRGYMLGGVAR